MKIPKKILILPLVLLSFHTVFAQNPVLISVGANALLPSDTDYQDIYGRYAFYPDFTLGLRIFRGFYLLGTFGLLAKKGETPNLGLLAQSQQQFLTANIGYIGRISGSFSWKVAWGPALVFYKEEALETSITGNQIGFDAELGLFLDREDSHLFFGLTAGYLSAKDTELGIKLGGPKVGLCFGFK